MMTRQELESLVGGYGFRALRVARIPEGGTPGMERYDAWLRRGFHADLSWMERGRDLRADPRLRIPELRSVLSLAMDHHHRRPPDPGGLTGKVARYAWGRDYHNLIGKRLKKLLRTLREAGIPAWGGVDSAPIFERSWAAASGLGFRGRNSCQIVPARGSWFFLATVFVGLDLQPDPPLGDHCGRCRRCLDHCPTDAFVDSYQLDSRRCIAYWTIEARGAVPPSLRGSFGRWVFGCDLCQEICPHNAAPPDADEEDFRPRHAWLDLEWLLDCPEEQLMEHFRGTPLRRPGALGLKRNACIALGNLGDPAAAAVLRRAERGAPLVSEHARWALDQLGV